MNTKNFISVIVLVGSLGLMAGIATAQPPNNVNCDRGESLNDAVNRQVGHAGPITINVTGTCDENVFVRRDRITINGINTATVVGTINVTGSDLVALQNIVVTGSQVGIDIFSSSVFLFNVTVTGIDDWTAIVANENSSLSIRESSVNGNDGNGVFVGLSSSLVINDGTAIRNNGNAGLAIYGSSTLLIQGESSIQDNTSGIDAVLHSVIDIQNADVSNNSWAGIVASQDSAVKLRAGNTVSGNGSWGVYCEDTESSFVNQGSILADPVSCTDFNQ